MPNGPTHRKISHIVQIASTPALFYMDFDNFLALQAGLAIATRVTPDLDLYNPFGGLGEFFGFGTYKRGITHRSGLRLKDWKRLFSKSEKRLTPWSLVLFSHLPWFGTSVRTLLCILPILVLLAMFEQLRYVNPLWILWIGHGMAVQDTAHSIADLISSHFFAETSPGWHLKREKERRKQETAQAKRSRRLQSLE